MNGFAKHNLQHTSPSQINMYAEAPCAWVAKYLCGKSFSFGVAAQVGVLTEQVVAQVITEEKTLEQALKMACETFNKNNALNTSEKERARVDDIEPMATLALEYLKPYGVPEFDKCMINGRKQKSIELLCNGDGWQLPVIGYTDLEYPTHGLIVDLKTTLRMPSIMPDAHKRQAAIYSKASGNKQVRMLYVTPKKAAFLDLEDTAPVLAEIKSILNRQERMLRFDKQIIQNLIPVRTDSFYWMNDEHIRKELYGI